MSFLRNNWAPIGGQSSRGRAPQVFSYRTADTHATVDTSGYFNDVAGDVEIGDTIRVSVVDDPDTPTSLSTYGEHVVNAKSAAGVVDVSNVTAGVVTDTD